LYFFPKYQDINNINNNNRENNNINTNNRENNNINNNAQRIENNNNNQINIPERNETRIQGNSFLIRFKCSEENIHKKFKLLDTSHEMIDDIHNNDFDETDTNESNYRLESPLKNSPIRKLQTTIDIHPILEQGIELIKNSIDKRKKRGPIKLSVKHWAAGQHKQYKDNKKDYVIVNSFYIILNQKTDWRLNVSQWEEELGEFIECHNSGASAENRGKKASAMISEILSDKIYIYSEEFPFENLLNAIKDGDNSGDEALKGIMEGRFRTREVLKNLNPNWVLKNYHKIEKAEKIKEKISMETKPQLEWPGVHLSNLPNHLNHFRVKSHPYAQ
jgi:hypothetical protein